MRRPTRRKGNRNIYKKKKGQAALSVLTIIARLEKTKFKSLDRKKEE